MTIAEWCVFGTLMLYLLTIASVKWAGYRHFDNARPRDPTVDEGAERREAGARGRDRQHLERDVLAARLVARLGAAPHPPHGRPGSPAFAIVSAPHFTGSAKWALRAHFL